LDESGGEEGVTEMEKECPKGEYMMIMGKASRSPLVFFKKLGILC
jgi:hypothetical protein